MSCFWFCFCFFPTHSKFLPFCCLDFFLCFSLRGSDLLLSGLNDTNRKSTVRLLTLCPHRKQGASQSPLFPPRPVLLHASVRRCPRRAGRAAGQEARGGLRCAPRSGHGGSRSLNVSSSRFGPKGVALATGHAWRWPVWCSTVVKANWPFPLSPLS